jgi:transcriptional regulator with XRE-family HTH domain
VNITERLRQLMESKNLSHGDIERRTGLLRCYISRVENGHTIPSVETLEKIARALETPMYQLFYDGEEPPEPLAASANGKHSWPSNGRGFHTLMRWRRALSRMNEADRALLLYMAGKMVNGKRTKRS